MRSLRFQLIFWNTAILGIVLIAVAGSIAWLNLKRLSEGIDRDLIDRSRGFGRMGGPRNGPGGGLGQPDRGPNGEGFGGQNPPRQDGPGPNQGQLGQTPNFQQQRPPQFRDAESERIGSIRRPRLIGKDGRSIVGPQQDGPLDPVALKNFNGTPVFTETVFQGERVRVYTTNGPPNFAEGAVLQLARELRDYRELARVQWITLLTVLPLGILLAALGGRFLTTRAMRPIGEMGHAAADIGAGRFDRRIPVAGDDEFANLGKQFNAMATQLGLSFEQQKTAYEQLAAAYDQQRRFVADASHELRTPLTRLQLVTSEALADPQGDLKRAVEIADQSAQSMANLVRQLLELAKADAGEMRPQKESVDLRALAADLVEEQPDAADIHLDLPASPVRVSIDPSQIARALSNLLENARRYSPPRSPIFVTVTSDAGQVRVSVRDQGEGISPEHLPHVTERFYRADAARDRQAGGTGLGLAIVTEIMRAHGGSLVMESTVGVGTTATLVFAG